MVLHRPIETTTLIRNVKIKTGRSSPASVNRGSVPGLKERNKGITKAASRIPSVPPISESKRLSVKSWRVRRPRVAPRVLRSAISFSLAVARASRRLATFAQAISNTRLTAISNIPERKDRGCSRTESSQEFRSLGTNDRERCPARLTW
jgi:hypothetical protein